MSLNARESQDIFIASLLADIGKLGFTDDLINTPITSLTPEQSREFYKHAVRAEQLLMPLDDLHNAAKIIRSQHERYDGHGLPDGLSGGAIPLGSRILNLAIEYHQLQNGIFSNKRLFPDDAKAYVYKNSGSRYDPVVVEAFKRVFDAHDDEGGVQLVSMKDAEPGMMLASDLVSKDGMLLLPADYVLEANVIEKLRLYDIARKENLTLRIAQKRKT